MPAKTTTYHSKLAPRASLLRIEREHLFDECRELLSKLLASDLPNALEQDPLTHLSKIATLVLTHVLPWLNVEAVSLLLHDGATDSLRLVGIAGLSSPSNHEEIQQIGEHLTGEAFAKEKTVVCNDLAGHPKSDKHMIRRWSRFLHSQSLQHAIFVPFVREFECRGVFRAFNRLAGNGSPDPYGFQKDDEHVTEIVADFIGALAAIAWERQQLSTINTMPSQLTSQPDVRELAARISSVGARIANAAAAALYLLDDSGGDYLNLAGEWGFAQHHPQMERFAASKSIAGGVATVAKSRVINDLRAEKGVANREIAIQEGHESCAIVPVLGNRLRGCLAVFSRHQRRFHPMTLSALEHLGLFAGSLVELRQQSVEISNLSEQLAVTGHSLRGPLTRIAHCADEIRVRLEDSALHEAFEPNLRELFRELERADRRISTLLYAPPGILRVTGLNQQLVRLGDVLQECVDRHIPQASRRHIRLVLFDSAKNLPPIVGDEEKLDLVFDNIIENAVKYSWANEKVEIRGHLAGRVVTVTVTDRGLGVPEAYYEEIFQGLVRSPVLDRTRYIAGTGLGLRIVKLIVEGHRGTVRVESTPFLSDPKRIEHLEGFVTLFEVTLPIQQKGERNGHDRINGN